MSRPNVVFLMSDQHRAVSAGCYGSLEVLTPHLDAFAKESVVFEQAYCQYPQCVASRQSLHTGQYPSRHGAYGINLKSIDPEQWTVAQAFRQAGYRTVLIGHPHSNENGFTDNRNSDRWAENQPQAVRDIVKGEFFGFDYLKNAATAAPLAFPEEYLIDDFTWKEAVKFIKEKPQQPFYLWITFHKPHPPFNPPERFWNLYRREEIVLPPADPNRGTHPFWPTDITTDEMKRNYLHGYYASISYIDWCIGNILDALRKNGLFENSIVAYTSDHGENGGWHGSYEKHCFYDPAIRVPLIVRTPDSQSRRVSEPVELMDITPTFTELCCVPADGHRYDAVSLTGLLDGHAEGWKNRAVCEYYQKQTNADGSPDIEKSLGRMLLQDGFKCCINGNMIDRNSLFNMEQDPEEIRNLWNDPAHRERRDRMVEILRQDWRREWYPYPDSGR
jgi:choline-sulfatase